MSIVKTATYSNPTSDEHVEITTCEDVAEGYVWYVCDIDRCGESFTGYGETSADAYADAKSKMRYQRSGIVTRG